MTANELMKIGFRGFEFPKKLRKDNYERLVWMGFFRNDIPAIRIVKKDIEWELELISSKYKEEIIGDYFKNRTDIESIVSGIKRIKELYN
ncbi:MAG: hypothetical protein Q8M29_16540 [Bacteroidota bacterium]|nr:hypothetical protein [Bacteroidota bacterium]